jgi:glycosyltransferase involved in cell wall biosynthesis
MKILRVTSDLYPYVVGGLGLHTHEMSKSQVIQGHDVTVITLTKNDGKNNLNSIYKLIKIKNFFTIFGNSFSLSFVSKFYKIHANFDIIHAHSHLFFTTNVCAAIRRFNATPLIITNHGLISQTAPDWLQRLFIPTIAKWTFESADKIICYTTFEKNQLIELGIDGDKIAVINNGIDTQLFKPNNIRARSEKILWIGRYIHGKGVHHLIDAFVLVLQRHPNAHLILIGDGLQKEEIQKKIQKLDISEHITQKNFVDNENLPAEYQNSDVFVLPSLSEGLPRTILESMACGIPVVCTELPQIIDLVEGAGFLVPHCNPDALASAIIKIIENPDFAAELGKNGAERIVKNYSWKDTVSRTLNLYSEVLSRK